MAVVVKPRLSPHEFVAMMERGELKEEALQELVDGEVIELPLPYLYHGRVAAAVFAALLGFAQSIGAILFGDNVGYLVGPLRQQVRAPDISMVTKDRKSILPAGAHLGLEAPDLCVEVLSGGQRTDAYARPKVAEYFAANAKVVWLLDTAGKTLRSYESGQSDYKVYSGDTQVDLDAIAPGFLAKISSFFPSEE